MDCIFIDKRKAEMANKDNPNRYTSKSRPTE